MNKTEKALVRKEIRGLKGAMNARQKDAARAVKKTRAYIRDAEKHITEIERDCERFAVATMDRIAVLEGRLQS